MVFQGIWFAFTNVFTFVAPFALNPPSSFSPGIPDPTPLAKDLCWLVVCQEPCPTVGGE